MAGLLNEAGKTLDEWVALPNVLRVFRGFPGDNDWYAYKEGLPFRGVWGIHRRTDMSGTEGFFHLRAADKADALLQSPPLGILFILWLAWKRRKWLKAHAVRMPRAGWRHALRLH
ncbi:MAG: hypothetical protein IT538_13735 [Variibacter sp.]|nr:hypothetical protein [Variibacter sp.]